MNDDLELRDRHENDEMILGVAQAFQDKEIAEMPLAGADCPLDREYVTIIKRIIGADKDQLIVLFPEMLDLELKILSAEHSGKLQALKSPLYHVRECTSMRNVKEPYGISLIHKGLTTQIYNVNLLR